MNRESIKKYKKNLKFFKKQHPDIYDLIKKSSNEDIELVQHNGKLNIKSGSKLFYPDDYLDSLDKKIDDFLNADIESFILTTDKPPKYYDKPLHSKYLKKISDDFKEIKDKKERILIKDKESLFYFIIYGIGLGIHIEKLLEKIKIKNLFLIEENIDFFLASLYAIDWENIFKKSSVTLILGNDISKQALGVATKINHINETFSYRIYTFVHYHENRFVQFKKELKSLIFEENANWGFFDDEAVSLKYTLMNIKNKIPFYIGKNRVDSKTPLFIVASGPSLEEAMSIIKRYRDKAVIFSCGTALRPLLKNQILPDFEIVLERMRYTYDALLENATKEELKKISIIGVNVIYPDVFKLGKENFIIPRYPDTGANLFEIFNPPKLPGMTPTVTNMAMALGLHLGFRKIYLFGTDMGFIDEERHHAKDSIYYKESNEFKTKKMKSYKEVEGNFTEKVYTTQIFNSARRSLEALISLYPDAKVFNTANGAKIRGAKPLKIKDFILKEDFKKKSAIDIIKSNFKKDIYNRDDFKIFIKRRTKELIGKIDDLKYFIQNNILLETFSEKDNENAIYLLYDKFEKEYSIKDEMFYVLFRGTLYHMLSFYYPYLTNLKDSSKQALLAKRFKQDLLNFLDESRGRLKKIFDSPIIKM